MTDYYSTMAAHGCIPCSETAFTFLEFAFIAEMERFEEEGLGFCLEAEYQDGKAFIYAEHYFDDECFTQDVCNVIGWLLSISGQQYLEFGYSQTASKLVMQSHGGGAFRIYSNGKLVWPKNVWPD